MIDELNRVPDRDELKALLVRYFAGEIRDPMVDELLRELDALLEDHAQRRYQVRMFDPENQVSWGEAWREEFSTRRVPTPTDRALMLAAKSDRFPPPRPYCPPDLVGSWEMVTRKGGEVAPDPRPRWSLVGDGGIRAAGFKDTANRWCVHRGPNVDRLWLRFSDHSSVDSMIITERSGDDLELDTLLDTWKRVRFRRV